MILFLPGNVMNVFSPARAGLLPQGESGEASFLLLANGVDYLLLADGVSKLLLA